MSERKARSDGEECQYTVLLRTILYCLVGVFLCGNPSATSAAEDPNIRSMDFSLAWASMFNGDADAEVHCTHIETDALDNQYITGHFSGWVDFDPADGQDLHQGNGSGFATKINADGSYGWTKIFGRSSVSLAINRSATVVAMGSGNTTELWLATGNWRLWQKRFDGDATIGALCFDPNDNLFIAGGFRGTVDFDPGAAEDTRDKTRFSHNTMFFSRFNADGSYAWTQTSGVERLTAGAVVNVQRVRSDSMGAIYIGGSFEGQIYFDPNKDPGQLVKGKGDSDAFVVKYTNDGEYLWVNHLANAEENRGYDLCIDPNDNVILAGAYSFTFHNFLGQPILPNTFANIGAGFVVKYSSLGEWIWGLGLDELDRYTAITGAAVTPTGDVLVAMERMPFTASAGSKVDLFVRLLDGTTTDLLWEQSFLDITDTTGEWVGPADTEHIPWQWGAVTNTQGDLFLCGRFNGVLPGTAHHVFPHTASGIQDGFILKFERE